MNKAVVLELSGETAFFKKPDVNANIYFSYSHIHKVALLGLFGAVLGFSGYQTQSREIQEFGDHDENKFPEFYQALKHLKIAVVPHGERGHFRRKIQNFNNSVGYASQEAGNNLIVREQWLEKPHWTIYVLDDSSRSYRELERTLLEKRAVYLPYLGKNDHPAIITDVRTIEVSELTGDEQQIDSLFCPKDVELGKMTRGVQPYYYQEKLPVALESKLNSYLFEERMYTNRRIKQIYKGTFFQAEERCLAFY